MAMKPRAMKRKTTMKRGGATDKKKTMMRGGGMTKANAGASVKPGQKSTMMRGGGMAKTKMMRGGTTKKK